MTDRDDIIEECAKVAEQYDNYTVDGQPSSAGTVIATALRWMKDSAHPHSQGEDDSK